MNIKKENIDDLNAVLSINIGKDDYEDRLNVVLRDYRKKARIDGFRPGKVPFGMINKMYRTPALVEEVNKLVSESVSKFLVDEKLNILGEPIPHEGDETKIDWENDSDFEFKFDLGLAPEFELKLSAKDKIPVYNVKADKDIINKYIESYTQRFGEFISVDKISNKDMLKAELIQLDSENNPVEEGIHIEEGMLSVDLIKDEKIKKEVLKADKGDILTIDLKKAYPNETELSSLLKVDKNIISELTGNFSIKINDISRFRNAELNQELFDKVFGEGTVKTEDEFREKLKEEAKKGLERDSEYRFGLDVKESLLKKFKSDLPKEFLKRWLHLINKGKFSIEDIEKEFDSFENDLKWQLLKDKVMSENDLKLEEEDIKSEAINFARMQFAQYGMDNVPDEHLQEFANRILQKEEDFNNVRSRAIEKKVVDAVRGIVKLEEKEISSEKFNKLFEK